MAIQKANMAEIRLTFMYKKDLYCKYTEETILPERISYIMIDHKYENIHILPVLYVSLSVSSEMYSKMLDSQSTSKFRLIIRKRNALSKTSLYNKIVSDEFSYVMTNTSANYSDTLDINSADSYRTILIGLVSDNMTNILRKSFNGVFNHIKVSDLVNIALDGMPNVIKGTILHDKEYSSILIPPLSSRYKLLEYINSRNPIFDSNYTFYMDFNTSYLIPKNGIAVKGKDNKPSNVIVDIKNYTSAEAYVNGYNIENDAYRVYVNAIDTNTIINSATARVTNNIIGYTDYSDNIQVFNINNNNPTDNTTKTTYIRDLNTSAIKNELEANSVIVELLKQNLDSDIFTPNKSFIVNNYGDYIKYNGLYILSYKREFFYPANDGNFIITTNVGLKRTGDEEVAMSNANVYTTTNRATSKTSKRKSTAAQRSNSNTRNR
jgi:hypothetical protein